MTLLLLEQQQQSPPQKKCTISRTATVATATISGIAMASPRHNGSSEHDVFPLSSPLLGDVTLTESVATSVSHISLVPAAGGSVADQAGIKCRLYYNDVNNNYASSQFKISTVLFLTQKHVF